MGFANSVDDVLDSSIEGVVSAGPQLRFCPSCGCEAQLTWKHCARCGDPLPWKAATGPVRLSHHDGDAHRHGLVSRTQSLIRQSKLDEASGAVEELLKTYPDDGTVQALAATVALRRYEIEDAREYLDRALELSPDSAVVQLSAAQYWLALGMAPQAMDALAKAEAAAADDPQLFNEIRMSANRLREKTRWNFSLQTSLPANSWLSRLFKRR